MIEDGNLSGSDVGDHRGDEKRGYPLAGWIVDHLGHLPVLGCEATYAGSEVDTEPERIDVLALSCRDKAGLLDCLVGSGYSKLGEEILLADEWFVHPIFLGVEILYLSGNPHRKLLGVFTFDDFDSAITFTKVLPECCDIISYRGNDTHTSYNNSFVHIIR